MFLGGPTVDPDYQARREAEKCRIDWPGPNNFQSIVARALGLITAYEKVVAIVEDYHAEPAPSRVPFEPPLGEGCHATEAPRGLLYHRYPVGEDGLIADARIVPPTAQNQPRIEADLRAYLPATLDRDDAEVARRCEHLVRTYDPCISCATHFLKIRVKQV